MVQSRMGIRYPMWTRADGYPELEEKTTHWLEKVRLLPKAAMPAKNLTHGEQRQLEIAMLLALETELLLLDEPTAGMSREEVPAILEVIRLLREEGERTILLIEHKMDLILSLSDRVLVLAAGRLLAEGTPEEIMKDERVQSAYLGGTLMLLEVKGIHTMIGRFHILQGVSFGVPRGEVTVLLGRNGAGKTTTIRSIHGASPGGPGRGPV